MRKELLEKLTGREYVEGNRNRGEQRISYPMSLRKRLTLQELGGWVKRQTFLNATRNRHLCRTVIAQALLVE